jgi:hypothetical protein
MKKLMLDLDALQVESFQPAEAQRLRGTVMGAEGAASLPEYCITFTCGDSHIRACLDAY